VEAPRRGPRWTESQLFLAALIAPILVYDIVLQSSRLLLRFADMVDPPHAGWFSGVALSVFWLLGDIAFALFSAVLLLVRDQHGKLWMTVAIALQAAAFLLGMINTASYVYFMQTVDALDWPLLRHMLEQPSDLGLVMAGEVTAGQWLLLGLVFVLAMAGPWLVRALAIRARRPPLYLGRERRSRRKPAAAVLLAVPAFTLALLPPPIAARDVALVRSPLAYIAQTWASAESGVDPAVDQVVAETRFFEPGRLTIERVSTEPLRNLVVIVLESTRARAVTPYEPSLQTTPFLASLAAQSLQVDKAYAVIPSTAKSLTAIFCSLYPATSLAPRALTAGLLGRCLPRLLGEQGYQTVYLQTANARFENRLQAVPNMGFATFIKPDDMPTAGFQEANFLGFEDDQMLGPSEAWLLAHRDKPFFSAYLTVDAHHDYNRLTRHGVYHFAPADDMLDRYLNNVRATDVFLEQLFAQYKRAGVYEKTLFVIVGDHGEAFGEHGRRAHNTVPYEEGLRVPLLIHDPTGKLVAPSHLPGPISQLDIMPTVLGLLGFRVTSGALHGISMFDSPRDRVLITSCLGSCATRVTATEAFIHHFGRREDELYDLRTDPLEREDLARSYPQLVQKRSAEVLVFQRRIASFYYLHTLHAMQPQHAGRSP